MKNYKPISFGEVFIFERKDSGFEVFTDCYIDNEGSMGVDARKEKVDLISTKNDGIVSEYFIIGDETFTPTQVSDWEFYIAKEA